MWSALEYGAHSRDITALHVYGVEQALTGAEPDFGPIAADDLIQDAAASYATPIGWPTSPQRPALPPGTRA